MMKKCLFVLILFSNVVLSEENTLRLEDVFGVNTPICYSGFEVVDIGNSPEGKKEGHISHEYYSHVVERGGKDIKENENILIHLFNGVTLFGFPVAKAEYRWPIDSSLDGVEYFLAEFFLNTKINNYIHYLKENKISVVRQDIQDDADVEGDVYTIGNDVFILKEKNGYLKMTCVGPG
ncbi:hypothetical protein [Aeromonas veronii]|uniref:hypothetical protein n=2 Tax=Aeromonas veronii TaxID=654 RepID=UPI00301C8346